MSRIRYYQINGGKGSKFSIRVEMVQCAISDGISAAARDYGTTRHTVRKWLLRYEACGVSGLEDRSRRPKNSPGKVPEGVEGRVIALRERYPTFGGRRFAMDFDVGCSHTTVYNILKRNGAFRKARRKWRRKKDLRDLKKKLGVLEKVQVDVKHLKDIPELYRALKSYKLPRYQYTARDVRTGMVLVAYAYEASLTNSVTFTHYLGQHVDRFGGGLKAKKVQTDNGSEFVGSHKAKRESGFTEAVKYWGGRHVRIPPRSATFNSDVEAFHGLVEREFYRVEGFSSLADFLGKAYAYVSYFNLKRHNRGKDGKAPYEIATDLCPGTSGHLFAPVPIVLDFIDPLTGVYHVPWPDILPLFFS